MPDDDDDDDENEKLHFTDGITPYLLEPLPPLNAGKKQESH